MLIRAILAALCIAGCSGFPGRLPTVALAEDKGDTSGDELAADVPSELVDDVQQSNDLPEGVGPSPDGKSEDAETGTSEDGAEAPDVQDVPDSSQEDVTDTDDVNSDTADSEPADVAVDDGVDIEPAADTPEDASECPGDVFCDEPGAILCILGSSKTCEAAGDSDCAQWTTPMSCDDGNPCTDDTCVDGTGCQHTDPKPGCVCTPTCSGKVCGPDGCTGICGSCSDGMDCTDGKCVTPCQTACDGKVCGDDQCGGLCGFCAFGLVCTDIGTCEPDCTPDCTGKQCGGDGCDGSCGSCAADLTCTPTGVCAPEGFVLIPAGTFMMGSPTSEPGRSENEGKTGPHSVTLTHAFWIKATEVTQKEWKDVMGTSPSSFSACGDDCPVERVSWWDALAYCNARSIKEGLAPCYDLSECSGIAGSGCAAIGGGCDGDYSCTSTPVLDLSCPGYRLPTEAEWEYAARGPTEPGKSGGTYNGTCVESQLGCQSPNAVLDSIAWFCGNAGPAHHAVAGRQKNAWGLWDMLGNILEVCWDGYDSGYYSVSPETDPLGPVGAEYRIWRGGAWDQSASSTRAARRGNGGPAYRSQIVGLRPAKSSLASCTPACEAKQCGNDGCGGSCGECPSGWPCTGICTPTVGGGCGYFNYKGKCISGQRWYCSGNTLYMQDCTALGLTCGYDATQQANICK